MSLHNLLTPASTTNGSSSVSTPAEAKINLDDYGNYKRLRQSLHAGIQSAFASFPAELSTVKENIESVRILQKSFVCETTQGETTASGVPLSELYFHANKVRLECFKKNSNSKLNICLQAVLRGISLPDLIKAYERDLWPTIQKQQELQAKAAVLEAERKKSEDERKRSEEEWERKYAALETTLNDTMKLNATFTKGKGNPPQTPHHAGRNGIFPGSNASHVAVPTPSKVSDEKEPTAESEELKLGTYVSKNRAAVIALLSAVKNVKGNTEEIKSLAKEIIIALLKDALNEPHRTTQEVLSDYHNQNVWLHSQLLLKLKSPELNEPDPDIDPELTAEKKYDRMGFMARLFNRGLYLFKDEDAFKYFRDLRNVEKERRAATTQGSSVTTPALK